jgi:hypothetical protein
MALKHQSRRDRSTWSEGKLTDSSGCCLPRHRTWQATTLALEVNSTMGAPEEHLSKLSISLPDVGTVKQLAGSRSASTNANDVKHGAMTRSLSMSCSLEGRGAAAEPGAVSAAGGVGRPKPSNFRRSSSEKVELLRPVRATLHFLAREMDNVEFVCNVAFFHS